MKKIILGVLCISIVLLLTGCESSKRDRKKMFSQLEQEAIIGQNYKQVDMISNCHSALAICACDKYYIYENDSNNKIAINFTKISNDDYEHFVEIYYDVTPNDQYEYLDPETDEDICANEGFFEDSEGRRMNKNKYNFEPSNKKKYYVAVERKLLFKNYKFVESQEDEE